MNALPKAYKFLIIFLALGSLSGCGKPTYPAGKIEESVLKLCKEEYKLENVKVKITGSTLGVYIPVDGLVGSDLELNEKAGKKIENVALSIHRVVTSTNMPLKFYMLTARDTRIAGAEFVLTGFVYDVIRVRLFDISRGEYFQRMLRDFRFNPSIAGEQKIRELFDILNKNASAAESLKSIFYPIYTIGEKGSQKIEAQSMQSKELSDRESLLYVKTNEQYKVSPGFEAYPAIFPSSGFQNEYLFLIDMALFPNPVKEVVSKYFYSNNEIRQRNLKETFEQYEDTGIIGLDGFPKKDLDLGWFLSQQISRRIKSLFEGDKKLKNNLEVTSIKSWIKDKVFHFEFDITFHNRIIDDKAAFSKIIKMASTVLHLYEFEEYTGIEFINKSDKGKKIFLSKEDMERFRKNEIKIESLL